VNPEGAAGRPLAGRRILVTRRREQSASLVSRLETLGAEVQAVPAIEIAPPEDGGPLDRALAGIHRYDWIAFTSANAVFAVADRLSALGLAGLNRSVSVASVGPATTEAIHERLPDLEVTLQPSADFRAEGLAEALLARGVRGLRFILPVSDRARPGLGRALAGAGASVDTVVAYRTVPPGALAERIGGILLTDLDLVVFASPSAVEALNATAGSELKAIPVAVLGPVTEEAARKAGFDVRGVAKPSTTEGLVAAVLRHFEGVGAS
jgi:uroporphyrinogen-III synthase